MTDIVTFPKKPLRAAARIRAEILDAAARRAEREALLRRMGIVPRVLACSDYDDLVDLLDEITPDFRLSLTRTSDAFVAAAERIAGGARDRAELDAGRAHLHRLLDEVLDGAIDQAANPVCRNGA